MNELEVFNGENHVITIITDYGSFTVLPATYYTIRVDKNAVFNQPGFYVQECGNWYLKTKHCHTLCDAEIYNAN